MIVFMNQQTYLYVMGGALCILAAIGILFLVLKGHETLTTQTGSREGDVDAALLRFRQACIDEVNSYSPGEFPSQPNQFYVHYHGYFNACFQTSYRRINSFDLAALDTMRHSRALLVAYSKHFPDYVQAELIEDLTTIIKVDVLEWAINAGIDDALAHGISGRR